MIPTTVFRAAIAVLSPITVVVLLVLLRTRCSATARCRQDVRQAVRKRSTKLVRQRRIEELVHKHPEGRDKSLTSAPLHLP